MNHPQQAGYVSNDSLHPQQQMQKSSAVEQTPEEIQLKNRINDNIKDSLDRWRPVERRAFQRVDTGIEQRRNQALGTAATDVNIAAGDAAEKAMAVNANRGVRLGSGRQVVGTEGGLALAGGAAKSRALTGAAQTAEDTQKTAELGIVREGQRRDAENLAELKDIAEISRRRALGDAEAKSRFRQRRIGLLTGGLSTAAGIYGGR